MELKDQVCSLELAKKLKELGVKQESICQWIQLGRNNQWFIDDGCRSGRKEDGYSAFTVAELGEILKENITFSSNVGSGTKKWYVVDSRSKTVEADTEADARAKMLIYLIENKLIQS
jgi:hypothetical protein